MMGENSNEHKNGQGVNTVNGLPDDRELSALKKKLEGDFYLDSEIDRVNFDSLCVNMLRRQQLARVWAELSRINAGGSIKGVVAALSVNPRLASSLEKLAKCEVLLANAIARDLKQLRRKRDAIFRSFID